jgi:radical SAM superfamily enzyme YgiQ (UPF0313 family)
MHYEGDVYRPPSEAYSLIIQLTIGCARNTCTFCNMYKNKKFRIRPLEDVVADLEECAALYGSQVKRIFMADGDAMIVKTEVLLYVLERCFALFPRLERVSAYAAPKDVLAKTPEELRALRRAGLTIAYMGLESGDDVVLENVRKGVTSSEITEAGIKLREAGIAVSITAISGLGSEARMEDHAIHTAAVISKIKPEYASLLTLMVHPAAPLWKDIQTGAFKLLTPEQIMAETRLFLEHIDSEGTVFRSNHASNYVALAGTFNRDIPVMLRQIDAALANGSYRPEGWRRL